jgi:hypothetical protein
MGVRPARSRTPTLERHLVDVGLLSPSDPFPFGLTPASMPPGTCASAWGARPGPFLVGAGQTIRPRHPDRPTFA